MVRSRSLRRVLAAALALVALVAAVLPASAAATGGRPPATPAAIAAARAAERYYSSYGHPPTGSLAAGRCVAPAPPPRPFAHPRRGRLIWAVRVAGGGRDG